MNSYKFRLQAAASSLPCAHRVQGEYCRCSEMGFTCTIAAALNRHIQKCEFYSPIFPTDFFQAFSKTSCLGCMTPPYTDHSHMISLSFLLCLSIQTPTGLTELNVHAHMRARTHTHQWDTKAQTFPTGTRRGNACTSCKSKHTKHPQRGQKDCSACRHTVIHTHTQSTAPRHTHLHASPYQRCWSSLPAPAPDALLRWKLYTRWKGKGSRRREEAGQWRDSQVRFAQGFFFFFGRQGFPLNWYISFSQEFPMIMRKWVIDQEQWRGEQEGERVCVRGTGTEIWQYPNSPPSSPHAKTLILTSRRKLLCMNAKSMIRSN